MDLIGQSLFFGQIIFLILMVMELRRGLFKIGAALDELLSLYRQDREVRQDREALTHRPRARPPL